jgi:hypothetical protein
MSGYYPGTFGFECENDGNFPSGWVDISGSGCFPEVVSSLAGHNKVLKLEDTSTTYGCPIYHSFLNQTSGTLELWFLKTVGTTTCYIILAKDDIEVVKMTVDSDNNGLFSLNVGGVYEAVSAGYSDNEWFHIRFDFNCGTDKADVYINGNLEFENKDFYNPADHVNKLILSTNSFRAGTWYTDALGYSWNSNYNVGDNINEGLLLSYVSNTEFNWTGFSLDNQANQSIFGNTTIPIPNDGLHSIQVFANDTEGDITESEIRYFTTNLLAPGINIISPSSSMIYGKSSPNFDLTITDPDVDFTWYSLDGGTTNIPFSGLTGKVDQTEWDKIGNGTATITFYANDTVNNMGQAEVIVRKDIIDPIITINEPNNAEIFEDPPIFDITVVEPNLEEMWYTLDGGLTNITMSNTDGIISQSVWNSASDGPLTIRFYARDAAGNVAYDDVYVVKRSTGQPAPPGIPGYNLFAIIGVCCILTLILVKKKRGGIKI